MPIFSNNYFFLLYLILNYLNKMIKESIYYTLNAKKSWNTKISLYRQILQIAFYKTFNTIFGFEPSRFIIVTEKTRQINVSNIPHYLLDSCLYNSY